MAGEFTDGGVQAEGEPYRFDSLRQADCYGELVFAAGTRRDVRGIHGRVLEVARLIRIHSLILSGKQR